MSVSDSQLPDPKQGIEAGRHRHLPVVIDVQAWDTPDRIAIVDDTRAWTYGEVARATNRLAHWLNGRGIGAGQLVAIHARRNAWTAMAMLGVLKSGAAFMVIDAAYPRDRIVAQLGVAKPSAWLETASPRAPAWLDGPQHVLVLDGDQLPELAPLPEQPPDISIAAEAVAYVVFTSGTTGVPKAVTALHAGLAHFVEWQVATFELTAADRFSALSGLAHPPLVREVFAPLSIGATVVVPAEELRREPDALGAWLVAQRITVAHMTPSLGQVLAHARGHVARELRVVSFASEPLVGSLVDSLRGFAPAARFVNLYGASETCQTIAFHVVPEGLTGPVPIGRGIDRTQLLLIDDHGNLAGVGGEGEICVRTPYLSASYLTGESGGYGVNPFTGNPRDRIYRTGDRGRYRPDGAVEILGRRDLQIKVRGFRVELGDVERAMLREPGVQQAVVVFDEATGTLVGYPVGSVDPRQLQGALRERLPDYMVPAALVPLEALPLTPNGKVDRRALPPPPRPGATSAEQPADAAADDLERQIAGVWKEVLRAETVGRHDNYFDLGGHSLNAIQVASRLRDALGVEVAARTIFDAPTVAELAVRLRDTVNAAVNTRRKTLTRTKVSRTRATVPQEYFFYLDRDDPDPASYFTVSAWLVDGPIDATLLAACYRELVSFHSVYRTSFREINGILHQIVRGRADSSPDELELVDASSSDPATYMPHLERAATELKARGYDLAKGHGMIRSRLIRLSSERHALVTALHHIATDGGGLTAFRKQLFDGYERRRAGASSALPAAPPLQYIDFAHANQQWADTPEGQVQAEACKQRLRGAQALVIEGDSPRDSIDKYRDEATLGITADLSHPPESVLLPVEAYAAVVAAARAARTTPFSVFTAGLAKLLHERSGQTDITIQTSTTFRPQDPSFESIHGCMTGWTVTRIDLAGAASFATTIERAKEAIDVASEHGPPHDFFRMVPHGLRRMVFNYLPLGPGGAKTMGELVIKPLPWPFPPWKRPWDLHLTLVDDSKSARLTWTGFQALFRRETVVALLERYIEILARSADR